MFILILVASCYRYPRDPLFVNGVRIGMLLVAVCSLMLLVGRSNTYCGNDKGSSVNGGYATFVSTLIWLTSVRLVAFVKERNSAVEATVLASATNPMPEEAPTH